MASPSLRPRAVGSLTARLALAFVAVAAGWIALRTRIGGDLPWVGFLTAWRQS